jgi:8-oxo-dGTP diphosphatase
MDMNIVNGIMDSKIITENMAGAFLQNNGNYLLLLRSPNKKLAPNLWSCPGGHIETNEFNDPLETCYREIEEETGIKRENIYDLKLRYIIIRQSKNTIRQSYVYFGSTNESKLIDTEEGTLHWIPQNELLNREYTKTFTEMIKHYVYTPDLEERIIVGIAGKENDKIKMQWTILEDFE